MRAPGVPAAPRRRLAPAIAALAVVGLILASAPSALAATSPRKASSSGGSRPKPTAAQKKSIAAFQKCLSKHGVKLPTHSTGGHGFPPSGGAAGGTFPHGSFAGGTANSASSKAFAACAKLAPSGFGGHFAGGPGGSFKPSAAEQQALTTYEQCMAGHGVSIAAGSTFQTIQSLIKEDPSAATANKACASDLKAGFSRPRSSGSGSGSGGSG